MKLLSIFCASLTAVAVSACGSLSAPNPETEIVADFVALDKAIQSFASRNGRFPDALNDLAEPDPMGRIWIHDLERFVDPFGRPYDYVPSRGSQPHNLVSLGPDGKPGSDDLDLRSWRQRRM